MEKRSENEFVLFKAGLFIIFTLSLLIFSILWLRLFSFTPDKTITARFKESGPISKGIPVYYKGVQIGKAKDIEFSDDYKYTLVKIIIYKKNMSLPKNIYAQTKTEGITGQKYIAISYPENPSKDMIEDGDTIEGRLSDFQEVVSAISKAFKNGQLEESAKNIDVTTKTTSAAAEKATIVFSLMEKILAENSADLRTTMKESALSAKNIQITSNSLKNFSTSPEINHEIKSTISNVAISSKKLNIIADKANKITDDINEVTGNEKFRKDITKTAANTGCFSERLNQGDLNCLITKNLCDFDRAVNRYDCIGKSFSEMMQERFVLMRLMFGKPGQSFQKCTNLNCIEENFYNPYQYCPPASCPNK